MTLYRNIKHIPELSGLSTNEQKEALKYAQLRATFTIKFTIAFILTIVACAYIGSVIQSFIPNKLVCTISSGGACYIIFVFILGPFYIHQARPHIAQWRRDHDK